MNRTNRILAALLVAQAAIVAIVFWARLAQSATDQPAAGPLFADLAANSVTSLRIEEQDGSGVSLARVDAGWVLPEADDYPALSDTVESLLDKVVALQADRPVTQTSASHGRLQVADDEFQRRLVLGTADGSTYTLYIGSSPQPRATHVRAGGQDEVYLVGDLSSIDANARPASWVDTAYLSVPSDQVVALTLRNANGELEFSRDVAGAEDTGSTEPAWTLADLGEDELLDRALIASLVSRATTIRLAEPLGQDAQAEYGLDDPAAVITLTTRAEEEAEPQTITITIGARNPEDGSYVISSSHSPYVVRVAEFAVQEFVDATRASLLPQPTPAPTPEQ